jgi:hypothetical protein
MDFVAASPASFQSKPASSLRSIINLLIDNTDIPE